MTESKLRAWSIAAIATGILTGPVTLAIAFDQPIDLRDSVSLWLLLATSAPFLLGLAALLTGRSTRVIFWAMLPPLFASLFVHALVAARPDKWAGLVLLMFSVGNLFLVLPIGVWIGVRQDDKHEYGA